MFPFPRRQTYIADTPPTVPEFLHVIAVFDCESDSKYFVICICNLTLLVYFIRALGPSTDNIRYFLLCIFVRVVSISRLSAAPLEFQ